MVSKIGNDFFSKRPSQKDGRFLFNGGNFSEGWARFKLNLLLSKNWLLIYGYGHYKVLLLAVKPLPTLVFNGIFIFEWLIFF